MRRGRPRSLATGFMMHYPRAPLLEAVINIRTTAVIDEKERNRLLQLGRADYAHAVPEQAANFKINVDPRNPAKPNVSADTVNLGVRLASIDQADVCLYRANEVISSRLAPYQGWNALVARAHADWARFTKVRQRPVLNRLGLRYINRIDIPHEKDEIVAVEDYLSVWARLPDLGDSRRISAYLMQIQRPLDHECSLIINAASVVSPLPNHASFVLDLDVFRENDLPLKASAMWNLFDLMRTMKNTTFEQLITDKARQLFQ